MRPADCLDFINEIEADLAVDEWSIGGRRVWPAVRFELWMRLDDYRTGTPTDATKPASVSQRLAWRVAKASEVVSGPARQARAAAHDRSANRTVDQADLLLLGDNVSQVNLAGRWYDRLCGPIVDAAADLGHATLQIVPTHAYRGPRSSPTRWIQSAIDRRLLVAQLTPEARLPTASLPGLDTLLARLGAVGADVRPFDATALRREAHFIELLVTFFAKLIHAKRARGVFIVDYGPIPMALTNAAVNAGLPVIELQHGVQGDLHWAYSRWNRVPKDGYDLLPRTYWTWAEEDARTIRSWADKTSAHTAVVSGYPWLERWHRDDDALVRQFDAALSRQFVGPRPMRTLVTLQPNLDTAEHLQPLIAAMSKTAGQREWLVRVHPAMSSAAIRTALDALGLTEAQRATSAAVSEAPLPAVLRNVGSHITHSSSAVIESSAFGVPSVVYGRESQILFAKEIAAGHAAFTSTGSEIVEALDAAKVHPLDLAFEGSRIKRLLTDMLASSPS